MGDAPKITPRMAEFLQWAEQSQPFVTWPIEWSAMRKKAIIARFLEYDRESGLLGFTKFKLSPAGIEALRAWREASGG